MSKTNLKKYRDKYKQVTLYLSHEEAATLEELRVQTSASIGLELTTNQLVKMMINNKSKGE